MKIFFLLIALITIVGCSTFGVIKNKPVVNPSKENSYSFKAFRERFAAGENTITMALSGGGTRAAALSYGVLKKLRNTMVSDDGDKRSFLDEVDVISSVSGGSFTAAYYGLHGDKAFTDFETKFLNNKLEGKLIRGFFNPLRWFSTKGRTELVVNKFENNIFKGATFEDMKRPDVPLIMINASDLAYGVRFSFIDEYFKLLCSNIDTFSISRAVTASAAVPLLINPIVLKNHEGCSSESKILLNRSKTGEKADPILDLTLRGINSYANKKRRKFAHLVDGGITDNLGLRALADVIELIGGVKQLHDHIGVETPRRLVFIAVNASAKPEYNLVRTNKISSVLETIDVVSDVQIHRYNAASIAFIEDKMKLWAKQLSTPQRPVDSYFIWLDFDEIKDPKKFKYINSIPTRLSISNKHVNSMIQIGEELLENNSEFQRLLNDIKKSKSTKK